MQLYKEKEENSSYIIAISELNEEIKFKNKHIE